VVRDDHSLGLVGSRTVLDRLLVQLARLGHPARAVVCPPRLTAALEPGAAASPGTRVVTGTEAGAALAPGGLTLVLDGATVYDERLLERAFPWTRPTLLVASGGGAPPGPAGAPATVGIAALDPTAARAVLTAPDAAALGDRLAALPGLARDDVAALPAYVRAVRRAVRPYWVAVRGPGDRRRARRVLAAAMSKGHMEWLVYVLNRPVERWLSFHLAETRVTPNQITFACNVVALGAAAAFAMGWLGPGLALALAVGILDGLDGRQARIQLRFTPLGKLEHLFDKIYEVAWMVALAWHFSGHGAARAYLAATAVWIATYFLDAGAYELFRRRRGMMIDEATRFDAAVRFVAGTRNTNVATLTLGLAAGMVVAAYWLVIAWGVVTAAVHWARVAWLLARPPAAGPAETGAMPAVPGR
jgi:phosphatidylglycerophosphate synthase